LIYAVSDLHLSFGVDKPMDVFGPEWRDHAQRLKNNWCEIVGDDDLVILPGDISWAVRFADAVPDIEWLSKLPGTKLLSKGNHDYWWSSTSKVKRILPEGMYAVQNGYFAWDGWAICAVRGWVCPGDPGFEPERDLRIYLKEVERLEKTLINAQQNGFLNLLVATHFPPFNVYKETSSFMQVMFRFGVKLCIYGHLHGKNHKDAFDGQLDGVEYRCVSADKLKFKPVKVVPFVSQKKASGRFAL
jgi:predicted phosphohydrolase